MPAKSNWRPPGPQFRDGLESQVAKQSLFQGFVSDPATAKPVDARGYTGMHDVSGTSGEKCPNQMGRFEFSRMENQRGPDRRRRMLGSTCWPGLPTSSIALHSAAVLTTPAGVGAVMPTTAPVRAAVALGLVVQWRRLVATGQAFGDLPTAASHREGEPMASLLGIALLDTKSGLSHLTRIGSRPREPRRLSLTHWDPSPCSPRPPS